MLLRFSVENFKSFKDRADFYMSAGKVTRHGSHLVEVNGKRILKSAFLFGANAGGKSNFISAIKFACEIVEKGLDEVSCDRKFFRVDAEYRDHPGVFQFDFLSNDKFYSYGFAISYVSASILEEWLYELGSRETCVFLRQKKDDGQAYKMDSELCKGEDANRLRVYMDDFKNWKLRQTLFMSDVASRVSDGNSIFQAFRDTADWFSKVQIIFPTTWLGNVSKLIDDGKTDFLDLLDHFDTGIDGIEKQEIDFEELIAALPGDISAEFKQAVSNRLKEKNTTAGLSIKDNRLEIQNVNGQLIVRRLVLDHGNPKDLFSFNDESDGTKRLFDLIPIYRLAMQDYVIFVDEIDRSLHTMLTQEFIDYFYKLTNGSHAQLIATTQDSNLMDLDILRQDEIWFVERRPDHSSSLYSLNKFKARFDKKIEKDYLLGRYGGIPVFSQFAMMEPENKEGDEIYEDA